MIWPWLGCISDEDFLLAIFRTLPSASKTTVSLITDRDHSIAEARQRLLNCEADLRNQQHDNAVPRAYNVETRTCHNCGKVGHLQSACPQPRRGGGGGAQWRGRYLYLFQCGYLWRRRLGGWSRWRIPSSCLGASVLRRSL